MCGFDQYVDSSFDNIREVAAHSESIDKVAENIDRLVDTSEFEDRLNSLEQSVSGNSRFLPWQYNAEGGELQLEPPYNFTSARLFINGVRQRAGDKGSYYVDNKIIRLAEPLEEGDLVDVELGAEPLDYTNTEVAIKDMEVKVNNLHTTRKAIEWKAGLEVSNALQLYMHNNIEYLPKASEVPFTTGASFEDSNFNKINEVITVFNTVADLKASAKLSEGMLVQTKGYYSVGDGGGAIFFICSPPQKLPNITLSNGLVAVYQERRVKLRQLGITAADETNIVRNTQIACDFYNEYGYLVDNFVDGDDDRLDYYFRDAEIFIKRNGQALNNFNFICVGDTKTTPIINFADVTDVSGRKTRNFYFTKIVNMRFTSVANVADIRNFVFTNTRDVWSTDITKPVASRYNCPNTKISQVQVRGFKCPFRLAGWQWSMDNVTCNNPIISACLVGTSLNATNFYTVGARYSVALGCDYNPETDTAILTNEGLAYSTFDEMPNDQITNSVILLGRVQGVSIDGFGVEQFASASPAYSKGIIKIASQNGPSVLNIKGGAFYLPKASQCIFDATEASSVTTNTTTVNISGVALREADQMFVGNNSGNVIPILNGNDEFNSVAGSNHYGSTHVNVDSRCDIMPPAMRNNYYVFFNGVNQNARIDEYQINATMEKSKKLRIPFGRSIGTGQGSLIMIKADIFPMFSPINESTKRDLTFGELIIHCYQYNASAIPVLSWKFVNNIPDGATNKITVTQGKYDETDDLYIDIEISSKDVTQTSMLVGYVRAGSNFKVRRKIETI